MAANNDAAALSAVPTVQAADASDAPGLDEMLDSVHPDYSVYVGRDWDGITYVAEVLADDATDSEGATVIATGTGATRMEAIANAVKSAKESNDDPH